MSIPVSDRVYIDDKLINFKSNEEIVEFVRENEGIEFGFKDSKPDTRFVMSIEGYYVTIRYVHSNRVFRQYATSNNYHLDNMKEGMKGFYYTDPANVIGGSKELKKAYVDLFVRNPTLTYTDFLTTQLSDITVEQAVALTNVAGTVAFIEKATAENQAKPKDAGLRRLRIAMDRAEVGCQRQNIRSLVEEILFYVKGEEVSLKKEEDPTVTVTVPQGLWIVNADGAILNGGIVKFKPSATVSLTDKIRAATEVELTTYFNAKLERVQAELSTLDATEAEPAQ